MVEMESEAQSTMMATAVSALHIIYILGQGAFVMLGGIIPYCMGFNVWYFPTWLLISYVCIGVLAYALTTAMVFASKTMRDATRMFSVDGLLELSGADVAALLATSFAGMISFAFTVVPAAMFTHWTRTDTLNGEYAGTFDDNGNPGSPWAALSTRGVQSYTATVICLIAIFFPMLAITSWSSLRYYISHPPKSVMKLMQSIPATVSGVRRKL